MPSPKFKHDVPGPKRLQEPRRLRRDGRLERLQRQGGCQVPVDERRPGKPLTKNSKPTCKKPAKPTNCPNRPARPKPKALNRAFLNQTSRCLAGTPRSVRRSGSVLSSRLESRFYGQLQKRSHAKTSWLSQSWFWTRPAVGALSVHSPALAGGGLVRDHLRKLHGLPRPAAVCAGSDRRALSDRDARRFAVHRQQRSLGPGISQKAQTAGRCSARRVGFRPCVLDGSGRPEFARPVADPVQ